MALQQFVKSKLSTLPAICVEQSTICYRNSCKFTQKIMLFEKVVDPDKVTQSMSGTLKPLIGMSRLGKIV